MKTRVVFTFDKESLRALEQLAERSGTDTLGHALGQSLSILRALYNEYENGYTELLVRNPRTGEERQVLWKCR